MTVVANAGRSRSRGVEIDTLIEGIDGLTLNTTLGYLDSEITRVEPGTIGVRVGDSPALTPRLTASVTPRYEAELANGGALSFSVNWSYRGGQFGQSINTPGEFIRSRDLVGFNISYKSPKGDWTAGIYGENVANAVYDQGRLQQTGFVGILRSNDRSEFGVRLSKKLGSLSP